jgi:hypothetical protein
MRALYPRNASTLTVALASILLWPLQGLACSCPEMSLDEAMSRAKAVFRGRVMRVDTVTGKDIHPYTHREFTQEHVQARVQVLASYRGAARDSIRVATGVGGGDCGFPFDLDEEYLIFAEEATGIHSQADFSTDLCMRSRPVEHAEADLVALGDPQLPARRKRQVTSGLVLTTVLLLVAAGSWYALRGRTVPPA